MRNLKAHGKDPFNCSLGVEHRMGGNTVIVLSVTTVKHKDPADRIGSADYLLLYCLNVPGFRLWNQLVIPLTNYCERVEIRVWVVDPHITKVKVDLRDD